MDIKLLSMALKNFKGVREFILNVTGNNANIYGENGAGKTTIYDAFLWLLFDKDSSNKKDFNIKTLDPSGEAIHGLEHEVEAVLAVDGEPLKLRKLFSEKWTKKRGEAEKEFTGHETFYWIDDVPVKKGEFQIKINSIIDETVFKLITNPFFFNTMVNWQDRRKTLLEIAGDVSDEAVITSDSQLSKLTEVLAGKSTDDYKKILNERIKKLNDEIQKIPVRIDELHKSMPEDETDYINIETQLKECKAELEAIEVQLSSASNSAAEYKKKGQELSKLQQDLEHAKRIVDEKVNSWRKALLDEQKRLVGEKYSLEGNVDIGRNQIKQFKANIEANDKEMERLRSAWAEENAKQFVEPSEDNFVCPTCGQELPEGQKESKVEELRNNFEASKKKEKERINIAGSSLKEANKVMQSKVDDLTADNHSSESRISEIDSRLKEISEQLDAPTQEINYEDNTECKRIHKAIQALWQELSQPVDDKSTELIEKKRQLTTSIEGLNKVLNNREIAIKIKDRIKDLKQEERQLASQISELEGQKFLIEQFVKTKVNMLEESINSKFRHVKFKLFDVQINGGVIECCETIINGVPWLDANHAGTVNAGLDIINTLCKHYKVSAPVFIDGRESVTNIIPIESQLINLIVSKDDKKLRLEVA